MKKILLLSVILLISIMPVNAETLQVQALSEFNTENPPASIEVKAVSDMDLDEELLIMDGYILKGNLVDVVSPKRLKRDATFSIVLTEYTDNNGQKHIIPPDGKQFKGKFTTKFDYKHAAKTAALSVGNFFLKGLSIGYAAVEGAVKNEEGNRVKSSAMSVYESTPVSYVEKGEDIVILKDQVFYLKFKLKDDDKDKNQEISAAAAPEKLPDNPDAGLLQENTAFQEKAIEETASEPESISKEEKERRMNLKAPLPGEEYGVTIEDLQAEVLNMPAKQEEVAFRFGRSDAKKQTEFEDSTPSESSKELLQPAQSMPAPEQEKNIEEKAGPQPALLESKPVSDTEKSAPAESLPAEQAPVSDEKTEAASPSSTGREFSNVEEFRPQSKILKLRKNSKTNRLQPVEDSMPAEEENMKETVQPENSEPQASENSTEVQTILTSPNAGQQAEVPVKDNLPALQEHPSASSESEQVQTLPDSEQKQIESPEKIDNEQYTIPAKSFNQTSDTNTNIQNNNNVAAKPLKRHSADSFENLVPELPAASETPLAPLELPDTY